jgi:uncharacterized protein YeaO (DUF488 family)
MVTRDQLEPFHWKPGQSGNPAGKPKKPRRSFDAVQRLQALHVDPLEEVVALAQDTALPKTTRLKAWMALLEYSYPKVAPIVPSETVTATLAEQQRAWNAETWGEFKQAFRQELSTLPDDTLAALEKMDTKGEIGPLVMQVLLKFVEMRHEQAKAQDPQDPQHPQQPGLKVVL